VKARLENSRETKFGNSFGFIKTFYIFSIINSLKKELDLILVNAFKFLQLFRKSLQIPPSLEGNSDAKSSTLVYFRPKS